MSVALSTDLYQLTMMAGYYNSGLMPRASFELYVRELPRNRSFLVAGGLEQALEYLEGVRFTHTEIEYLRRLPVLQGVRRDFFDDYLPRFRFTGEVWAVEEGTPIFPPSPLLRVTAPLPEAQLVETALLAYVGFQTSVASRAVRIVEAAAGRPVVEFGARRAHGLEAGVLAARAAFLGGCAATSSVEAGRRFGIPVSGTMAHSWVTAFPEELEAFRQYAQAFGGHAVLLLDTFDTIDAARSIVAGGLRPQAVRLDSGDLVALSRQVRAILDEGGLRETEIFVSGDLDEWRIQEIIRSSAPADGFGVGAALSTASDAPSLGAVYKLVEIERAGRNLPIMKRSVGKQTHPGRKQIWRNVRDGQAIGDLIELDDRTPDIATSRPLLTRVMSNGQRDAPAADASELRMRSRAFVAELPEPVRRLQNPERYPVQLGGGLRALMERAGVISQP